MFWTNSILLSGLSLTCLSDIFPDVKVTSLPRRRLRVNWLVG